MPLTAKERELAQQVATLGPSALTDADYDVPSARDFMERSDVKAELERLNLEFNHQDVLEALLKFGTKRQLARLAPKSVEVLGEALEGPIYLRDRHGVIRLDDRGNPMTLSEEPTRTQMKAATEVLDRIGVASTARHEHRLPNVNLNVMFQKSAELEVEIALDPTLVTAEQQALSRERIRNTIEQLRGQLPDIRESKQGQKLLEVVGVEGKPVKTVKRKMAKKNIVKKRMAKQKVVKPKTVKPKTVKKKTVKPTAVHKKKAIIRRKVKSNGKTVKS